MSFGAWEPDSAGLDMKDSAQRIMMADARNVYPAKTGYTFVPSLKPYSNFTLPSKCVGAFTAHAEAGGHVIFAGTKTALYRYNVSTGWVDVTRVSGGAYHVAPDEQWVFAQFGGKIFAVNINDNVQMYDLDGGATKFVDAPGSPPAARYVGVIGDFLILACLASNKSVIANSAINDTAGWTPGVNLSDTQEFADGQDITGFASGEFGWVVQEHAIRRMIFQPGYDQAFRFERVEHVHGGSTAYGLVAVANTIFFPADDGFYSFGNQLTPIGTQRINDWFRANSDVGRFWGTVAFNDFYGPRIYWAFYGSTSSQNFDRILIYDWAQNQFSYATEAAQAWGQAFLPAVTLDSMDPFGPVDTLPFSLDSRVWVGGQPVTLGILPDGRLGFLNGPPLPATLLTTPMQLTPSRRTFVKGIAPLGVYNGASLAMRIGRAPTMQSPMTFTAAALPSTRTGIARLRADGRAHQFELNISQSSGISWRHAEGIDVDGAPTGEN